MVNLDRLALCYRPAWMSSFEEGAAAGAVGEE
jgi:hypothetical protein